MNVDLKICLLERHHMRDAILLLQNLTPYQPPEDNYEEIWSSFRAQPNVFAIVAQVENTLVGYGALLIETKIRGGKLAHLEDIVAHPDWQRMGIGQAIVGALIRIAKEQGCYKIVLYCQPDRLEFYTKSGFVRDGSAMNLLVPKKSSGN